LTGLLMTSDSIMTSESSLASSVLIFTLHMVS
jgi:hypothetical protein